MTRSSERPDPSRPPKGSSPRASTRGQPASIPSDEPERPHDRFLSLERDRALREWTRYEGTPQRALFRELRERFLARHAAPTGWCVDLGCGPGRFSSRVGGPKARHVALDLSRNMLEVAAELAGGRTRTGPHIERVRGDAGRAPFVASSFAEVALLGNTLGFAIERGPALLGEVEQLVAPGGTLTVEIAPGPGERSTYLARLPPGAVRRLMAAPRAAILPRVAREGFRREPVRHRTQAFRRWHVAELEERWTRAGWRIEEAMAVAPALGVQERTLRYVAEDPAAWQRLVELEEELGRLPARHAEAAAVLVAGRRPPSAQTI